MESCSGDNSSSIMASSFGPLGREQYIDSYLENFDDDIIVDSKELQLYQFDYEEDPSSIFHAATTGDIDRILTIIKEGRNLDDTNSYENSSLMLACYNGRVNVLESLLSHGADAKISGNLCAHDQTLWHAAALGEQIDVIDYIKNLDIDINHQDSMGDTALHIAAKRGLVAIMKRLIALGASVDVHNHHSQTPLMSAVFRSHDQVVSLLIESGAYVHTTDKFENNILHVSTNASITEDLIVNHDMKTVVGSTNKSQCTPLHIAVGRCDECVVKVLLRHMTDLNQQDVEGSTAFLKAICLEQLPIAELLFSAGADINMCDEEHMTPIHYAASNGQDECVKFLCKRGADLNVQSIGGHTPLHELCWELYFIEEDTLECMLNHGANPNAQDYYGLTPLHVALLMGSDESIRILLEHGASVSVCSYLGENALFHAMRRADGEATKMILEHTADVNHQDRYGSTALHLGSAEQRYDSMKLLLGRPNINPNLRSKTWATPLHTAIEHLSLHEASLLLDFGSNVQCVDKFGSTVLHTLAFTECTKEDARKFLQILNGNISLDVLDDCGQTAVDVAKRMRNDNLLSVMEEMGLITSNVRKSMSNLSNVFTNALRDSTDPPATSDIESLPMTDVIHLIDTCPKSGLNVSYMEKLFSDPCYGWTFLNKTTELEDLQNDMNFIIKELTLRISATDSRFKCAVTLAGSMSENTKVGLPDEFDFLVCLSEFEKMCRPCFEKVTQAGFAAIVAQELREPTEEFKAFFKKNVLVKRRVIDRLRSLLIKAITDKSFPWPSKIYMDVVTPGHHTQGSPNIIINLVWRGSYYKKLPVSVDFVPAICVDVFPQNISPLAIFSEEVARKNVVAVSKNFRGQNEFIRFDTHEENQWLISFTNVERHIINSMPQCARKAFISAKAMANTSVCPPIVGVSKLQKCQTYTMSSVIPTYYLKMALLHILEDESTDNLQLSGADQFCVLLEKMMSYIERCVEGSGLPCFFQPKLDIIGDRDSLLVDIIKTYCKMVKCILRSN